VLRNDDGQRQVGFLYGNPRRGMLSPVALPNGRPAAVTLVGRFDADDLPDVMVVAPPDAYLLAGNSAERAP